MALPVRLCAPSVISFSGTAGRCSEEEEDDAVIESPLERDSRDMLDADTALERHTV